MVVFYLANSKIKNILLVEKLIVLLLLLQDLKQCSGILPLQ